MSVINPWWFYWIDVLDKFLLLVSLLTISLFVTIFVGAFWLILNYEDANDREQKGYKKLSKIVILSTVISCFLLCAIPSKTVMYQIVVAKHVTYENLESAGNVIKDSVDYIFDKLDGE